MNNAIQNNQYTIEDTINGLVITYQGRKTWWLMVYPIIWIGLFIFGMWNFIPSLFQLPAERISFSYLAWITFELALFAYVLYMTVLVAIDALFDKENITINDRSITIEKSGFQTFIRNKEITTDGKLCFFVVKARESMISFSTSKFISQLSKIGMLFDYTIDPMRCFMRGIPAKDAVSVMEKINSKYPNYEILVRKSS